MKIYLPNSAFLGNIDPFLRAFDTAESNRLEITANKKWISLHPVALSLVAALGLTVDPSNTYCEQLEAISRHYLERMGLFKLLQITTDIHIKEHEPAGRFIPLTQIHSTQDLTKFIQDMVPLLHLNPTQAEPIKYIISELGRNVFEHADSKIGALFCAQYYQKTNTIRLGIVDTGVGIRNTISVSHKADSDMEAIGLALTPGITGTTKNLGGTDYNAGAGLFFIKSIAKVNRNFFMIYSGNAMYKLLRTKRTKRVTLSANPFKDSHSGGEDFPYWQGTAVGIDISLDSTEEFSNLLELIKKTISEAMKARKKEIYKKAVFI